MHHNVGGTTFERPDDERSDQRERDDMRYRRQFREEGTARLDDGFGGYYGNGGQAQGGYMGGMGSSSMHDAERGGQRDHRGRGPKGYQLSDESLRERVCQRLSDHPDIDASNFEVHVVDREVTLVGQVEDKHTRRLAEDVVANMPGVRDVHNQLRLGHSQQGHSQQGGQQSMQHETRRGDDQYDRGQRNQGNQNDRVEGTLSSTQTSRQS
jgi:osmotically-inducible protein OsmY